jgi:hypothetical protein
MSLDSLGAFYQMGRTIRVDTSCNKEARQYTETLTGTDEEQKAYIAAGFDAVTALAAGVSAIGKLLALSDADDKGVTNETMEQVGYLVTHLGELTYAITSDLQYVTHVRVNGGVITHN